MNTKPNIKRNIKQNTKSLTGECTLYLLRHGEIATPGILAGKTNVALSKRGLSQLSQATNALTDIQRCISSPLIRCHSWASMYCDNQNLTLDVDDRLQEMDFGDWDGQLYQSLWDSGEQSIGYSIGDFWQNPWQHQPPNGETMTSFVNRVDDWWDSFLYQISSADEQFSDTLVITHGGVIKHLLARVLNLPIPGTAHMASIDVPYGCLIKISLYRDASGQVWSKLLL